MERVESLSGTAKSTFRRNDQVVIFYPDTKVALAENRESLGTFPNLLKSTQAALEDNYQIRALAGDRVVGLDTDVVQLKPKDTARFGYRVWTERKSGLVVRLQTLDAEGRVLEQSAFSELQLDAPVSMSKLTAMMANTAGYRVERPDSHKTTALEQGWIVRSNVGGFQPLGCVKRVLALPQAASPMPEAITQCMFSDGLATLSLFMEPYDARRNTRESSSEVSGATHTLTLRNGDWWITAVGEVPLRTLQSFALALERKK
jgi:sigma-E factor negative regulatory protein RseB